MAHPQHCCAVQVCHNVTDYVDARAIEHPTPRTQGYGCSNAATLPSDKSGFLFPLVSSPNPKPQIDQQFSHRTSIPASKESAPLVSNHLGSPEKPTNYKQPNPQPALKPTNVGLN